MILTTRPHGRLAAFFGPLLVAGIALGAAAPAEAQRIVMVIDPPSVETNRFWATSGDFGLNPAMQPLVGQDPETGAYDDSGLARSWEHNEDFTTWTFHLHEDAEFHFDWGRSPPQTSCIPTSCTPPRTAR